jgi:hypothetical protein
MRNSPQGTDRRQLWHQETSLRDGPHTEGAKDTAPQLAVLAQLPGKKSLNILKLSGRSQAEAVLC